jgi:hypothetical protein
MASNLDYLNPDLLPLEQKVEAYLAAEDDLRKATVESMSLTHHPDSGIEGGNFEQRPATGSFDQRTDEVQQQIENMRVDIAALRQEIIAMLPTRDEWVKVNLGYGPSRVGAFRNEKAGPDAPNEPEYLLRVVH